jgi:tRNA (guanine-N7-)-methyltransferase
MALPEDTCGAPLPAGPDVEVRLSCVEGRLDWRGLFGNDRPVVVEIGCGKGRFIIRSALDNPRLNYFGMERAGKFFSIMKQRVVRAQAGNILLLKGEADHCVRTYIADASVRAYHVLFPDPWPKKRHHKRRLVNDGFMREVLRTLVPGGCICFATDFEDYFRQMTEVSRACAGLRELYCRVILPESADPEAAATNYERKYLMQGRPIYRAAYASDSGAACAS